MSSRQGVIQELFCIATLALLHFLLGFFLRRFRTSTHIHMAQPRILYCHCTYAKVVPEETKEQVLEHLADADFPFEAVADLCEMSARKDPALQRLAQTGEIKIAACYPRAVRWLFESAKAPLSENAEIFNMREQKTGEICREMLGEHYSQTDNTETEI